MPQPGAEHLHLTAEELFPRVGAPVHVHRPLHEGTIPLHDHDFLEIAVMVEGHGIHRTIHGEKPITAGEVFVLHPGQWHAYESCRHLRIWNCLLGVELLSRELAWARSDPQLAALFPTRMPAIGQPGRAAGQGVLTVLLDANELRALCDELERTRHLLTGDDPVRARPDVIARILLILARLARHLPADLGQRSQRGEAEPHVLTAIQAMEERLEHDWGLVELSRMLELNRSYLVRLFKRHTGQSPMAWLARRRAEKAAVLLLTTDQPVAAVGRTVGWHDPNYFARRFRAAFGVSAREYRQQLPCPALVRDAADWIQW